MDNLTVLKEIIEKHKWQTAKYVLDNKTLDVGQSSHDLAKEILSRLVVDEEKVLSVLIEEKLGFSEDYTCELAETISQSDVIKVKEEK